MAGVAHQAQAGLKAALELLQKSVSELPMGSPLHQKTLRYIADVSKEMGQQEPGQPDARQQIASMARKPTNPNAAAAMQKLFPPPAPAGAGGGAPMAA